MSRRRPVFLLLATAFARRRRRRPAGNASRTPSHRIEGDPRRWIGWLPGAGSGPGVGGSAVHALPDPLEAYAARVLSARAAERSLDVQVYLWRDDSTGWLLLDEARQAAARGVRVRLLIDDIGAARLDPVYALLDALPGLEVRLFNPIATRGWARALAWLSGFARLHRRMHNKAWIVDGGLAIVGGRNIGDEYFAATRHVTFADLDLAAVGQVAAEVGESFDRYWNSAHAWPARALLGAVSPMTPAVFEHRLATVRETPQARACMAAVQRSTLLQDLMSGHPAWERCPVRLLADEPGKVETLADDAIEGLFGQLLGAMGEPVRTLDLVSPYFVPGEAGVRRLASLVERGVRVRVLTNSLAATDVPAVHAGYARWRVELLRRGIELHELRPDATVRRRRRPRTRSGGAASLHAKTFAVDGERIFVGSFNLDPRSVALNTEIGLLVESAALASRLGLALDDIHPHVAWRVQLDAAGALHWIGEPGWSGRREPAASMRRRLLAWMFSVLRIDWLL